MQHRIVLGWSRTRVTVDDGLILDLGSGAFPNRDADILCDGELADDLHRHGRAVVVDSRPFVVARAEALPFRDASFAFVIASHIAEHVDDPMSFCQELSRVAHAGYVETPSPLADRLLHEDYHLWRVSVRGGGLHFRRKRERGGAEAAIADLVYRVFYAGRNDCSRPTFRLPGGRAGIASALVLRVLAGLLNRVGVMHTRLVFDRRRPLSYTVSR